MVKAVVMVLWIVGNVVRREAVKAYHMVAWLVEVAHGHEEVGSVAACVVPVARAGCRGRRCVAALGA